MRVQIKKEPFEYKKRLKNKGPKNEFHETKKNWEK